VSTMARLYRKDWRVYRAAVVGGAALGVGPYVVMLAIVVLFPPEPDRNPYNDLSDAIGAASAGGIGLTVITGAVFGGVAFAAERRDRAAEFLAMLPVRRGRIALSKLLVALAFTATVAAVHAAVVCVAVVMDARQRELPLDFMLRQTLVGFVYAACMFVLFFGLSWMLSLYLSSPAIAATAAIGAGVILVFVTMTWAEEAARANQEALGGQLAGHVPYIAMSALSLVLGAAAMVGSTTHYVRRTSP
jgi:hypothetical protein